MDAPGPQIERVSDVKALRDQTVVEDESKTRYEYGYNFIPMSGYEFFNEYNFISRTSIGKHYLMGTYPLLSLHMLPWQTLEEGSRPANFLERIKLGRPP